MSTVSIITCRTFKDLFDAITSCSTGNYRYSRLKDLFDGIPHVLQVIIDTVNKSLSLLYLQLPVDHEV
jgi:hypothetical protein